MDNGHLESLVTLTMGNTSYHCESDKGRRATGLKTDANNLIYKNKKKRFKNYWFGNFKEKAEPEMQLETQSKQNIILRVYFCPWKSNPIP